MQRNSGRPGKGVRRCARARRYDRYAPLYYCAARDCRRKYVRLDDRHRRSGTGGAGKIAHVRRPGSGRPVFWVKECGVKTFGGRSLTPFRGPCVALSNKQKKETKIAITASHGFRPLTRWHSTNPASSRKSFTPLFHAAVFSFQDATTSPRRIFLLGSLLLNRFISNHTGCDCLSAFSLRTMRTMRNRFSRKTSKHCLVSKRRNRYYYLLVRMLRPDPRRSAVSIWTFQVLVSFLRKQ